MPGKAIEALLSERIAEIGVDHDLRCIEEIFFLFFIGLLPVSAPSLATDKPQRIVSIGLCIDQFLLMLAERQQIASVPVWALDH